MTGQAQKFFVYFRPSFVHASHGEDVAYVFGDVRDIIRSATLEERILGHAIMSAWTNFARTGYVFSVLQCIK